MERKRDFSIDILKFIAALIITNSHMELLYGDYRLLASGGAIGDALFFFASGFTLFLGRMGRFDNWYKRRINRIYPTVFAWAIISAFVWGCQNDMRYTIILGGGWFVSCIMLYYVALWSIRRLIPNRLTLAFITYTIVVIVCYLLMKRPEGYGMYGETYFKWVHYFLFMLLGAIIGKLSKQNWNLGLYINAVKLLLCIIMFYAIMLGSKHNEYLQELQVVSLIPLLVVTYYFYRLCNSGLMKQLYDHKLIGWCIKFIGGLCLEIYVVQGVLFTDSMNGIFPLNIPIMFIIIIAVAYLLRCASRIFSQTFKDREYDWKAVFKPV